MKMDHLRIGYGPYDATLQQPGDRRRFVHYAKTRGIHFEIADPDKEYDLVYLTARADIARWSKYRGRAKIVFELIDSYLALPPLKPKNLLRGLAKYATRETSGLLLDYRRGIEAMARRSDAVVCSTEEQRVALSKFCVNTHIILDVHTELETVTKTDYSRGDTLNVVWEGLVHTLDAFDQIGPILTDIRKTDKVAVHLLTDLSYKRYMKRFVRKSTEDVVRKVVPGAFIYEWNKHLLPHIATACDLAVIPLRMEDPFSNGKPENKLLVFWRLGVPTITSASPAYKRAMAGAGLDMTCASPSEWKEKLTRYAHDEDARREAGEKGRAFCAANHSEEQILGRWDRLFETVLG